MIQDKKSFRQVLWEDMKTPSFGMLLILFLISMLSNAWMCWDGSGFHFTNFFSGTFNNPNDITRILSVAATEFWAVAYHHLGGTSFLVSKYLFTFGHVYQIFFPFLLLTYLKYKEPALKDWAERGLLFYLLSLMIYTGFSFLFFVGEAKLAHSVNWMILFSFRALGLSEENKEFKERFLWTMSIVSLFTYPLCFFTFGFLILAQTVKSKFKVTVPSNDWRIFFLVLCVVEVALLIYYIHYWPNPMTIAEHLSKFPYNGTAKFLFFAAVLLFFVRPFFRGYFVLMVPLLFLSYLLSHAYSPWQIYSGRFIGVIFLALINFGYIFAEDLFNKFDWLPGMRARVYAMSVLVLAMVVNQVTVLFKYHNDLMTVVERENRVLTYEEAKKFLPHPANEYVSDYFVRIQTISLDLMKGRKVIDRYIDHKPKHDFKDILDHRDNEFLTRIMSRKGISLSAKIMRDTDRQLYTESSTR